MGFLKNVGEDLNAAASAWDTFKQRVAFVSILSVGVFLYFGPGELAEEFPWHRETGIGVAALAFVFIFAAEWGEAKSGFKRQVGKRCRALVFLFLAIGIGVGLMLTVNRSTYEAWRLSESGVHDRATVGRKDARFDHQGKYRVRYHLAFAGINPLTSLDSTPNEGSTLPVVYLPEDPTVFRVAEPDATLLDLLENQGRILTVAGALGVLVCLLVALAAVKIILLGPGPHVPPAEA